MVDFQNHCFSLAIIFAGVGIFIIGGTIFALQYIEVRWGVQQPLYLAIVIGVSALYVGAGLVFSLVWISQYLAKIAERVGAVLSVGGSPDDEE